MEQERQYLEQTKELIRAKIADLDNKMGYNDKQILEMQDYFWNSYNEFDEYGYELFDNTRSIVSKANEKSTYLKERHYLAKMIDNPYFARIDFRYEGEAEAEPCYIGLQSLSKSAADIPLVYDWRAPIASLFYDYEIGKASYDAPLGIMQGDITDKVQYKIKKGELVYAIHSEMNIDDDILKTELANHADSKLKSIVNTIQKEQNSIIRDTKHKILVVQGCAGSGKTSVAMHRIAYLLYHNRNSLSSGQVLILSPNDIFADYISRILPELGEENIGQMSLDIFAYHRLKKIGEAQDRYDLLEERLLGISDAQMYDYKNSKEFVQLLDGFILALESDIVELRDFSWRGRVKKAEELSKLFYEKLWDVPIFSRMKKISEFLVDEEETLKGKDLEEEIVLDLVNQMERMYLETDLLTLYNRFLESIDLPEVQMCGNAIPYEDVYPLLYLQFSLWENKQYKKVKHLIIDEMQDYSYLQYRILTTLFHCSMTILGDEAQYMNDSSCNVLSFLPEILGKDACFIRMEKSYRSTQEITEYAANIIGKDTVNCVGRHGKNPEEICCSSENLVEQIATVLQNQAETLETVAVLCLHQEMADELYEKIVRDYPNLQVSLLTKDSKNFSTGICITTYYLAKGLEFDTVLVPHLELYENEMQKQALYIEATRTLHELYLFRCVKP